MPCHHAPPFGGVIDGRTHAKQSARARRALAARSPVVGGDALFDWAARCPDEQVVSLADGLYEITVCMLPQSSGAPVRIYLHFAPVLARPKLGYGQVPELMCRAPLW